MIDVTRLVGGMLVVNVDLILAIETTPDTVIVFSNGERLLVREAPAEIVKRVVAFKQRVRATMNGNGHGA